MHHLINRIAHTTIFVNSIVVHCLEREIAQWIYQWIDPTTYRIMIGRSTMEQHLARNQYKLMA